MISALVFAALLQAQSSLPQGVYRSRGYGWIIDRTENSARLYHQAGETCWLDPDADPNDVFVRSDARPDGSYALASETDADATLYIFDPLERIPARCTEPHNDDRASVQAIADVMAAYYPGFAPRHVAFDARRAELLRRLPALDTPEMAFDAAATMLEGLGDAHIELSADLPGGHRALEVSEGRTLDAVHRRAGDRPERAWLGAWREGVEQVVLAGEGHVVGNSRMFWGVRNNIGYLAIVTMGGFDTGDPEATGALDAALDEAMAAFRGASAVIVDVSNNRGGYDTISLRIASRFADRTRVAYSKRAWGGGTDYQTISVEPSDRERYLGPVWLLTSDITVSAGETFCQMMRVLPNVTQAGTSTRGSFSDQTTMVLPNGWSFSMPMEEYVDPDGAGLEGKGLRPQEPLDLYPAADLDHGHSRAVVRLIARLSRQTPGRTPTDRISSPVSQKPG